MYHPDKGMRLVSVLARYPALRTARTNEALGLPSGSKQSWSTWNLGTLGLGVNVTLSCINCGVVAGHGAVDMLTCLQGVLWTACPFCRTVAPHHLSPRKTFRSSPLPKKRQLHLSPMAAILMIKDVVIFCSCLF